MMMIFIFLNKLICTPILTNDIYDSIFEFPRTDKTLKQTTKVIKTKITNKSIEKSENNFSTTKRL